MSTIQGGRGFRGLKYATNDDIIIDLCSGVPALPIRPEDNVPIDTATLQPSDGKTPPSSPQDQSYIHFDSRIISETDDGSSHALPLQKSNPINEGTSPTVALLNPSTEFGTKESSGGNLPAKPLITRTRPTRYKITFEGSLARVGYQSPVPNLNSVGGVKARKIGRDTVISKIVGTGTDAASGEPLTVYGLYWRKQYILDDRPNNATINSEGEISQYT